MAPAGIRVGHVQLHTGSVNGIESDAFGHVSGVAFHPTGMAIATDDQTDELILIAPDGRVLRRVDGNPEGPGHFGDPCCISVDSSGSIWIYSRPDRQFVGFDSAGEYLRDVGRGIPFIYVGPPLMFDDEGGYFIRAARPSRMVHLTVRGDTMSYRAPTLPVTEALGTITGADGRQTVLPVPYGRRPLIAYRGDGHYAHASSEQYAVIVHDQKGTPVLSVTKDVDPVRLGRAQLDSAQAVIDGYSVAARRSGARLDGFEIPEHEQVLERIWFDGSHRLWIQRTSRTREGQARADVYDKAGRFEFMALWPDTIALWHGAIRDSVAWGITKGPYGIDVIVGILFVAPGEEG